MGHKSGLCGQGADIVWRVLAFGSVGRSSFDKPELKFKKKCF